MHARAQILLVMRQTDAAHTQALASKVSLATLGQQAILDAHLCLVHLTTGAQSAPGAVYCRTPAPAQLVCMGSSEAPGGRAIRGAAPCLT